MKKLAILWVILGLLLVVSPAAAQGGTLTYGSSTVVSITAQAPFGIFTFSGNAGDQIMAYAVGISPGMTPTVSVLDQTQQQLATNDTCAFAGGNSAIACVSYRLVQSGTYSLLVSNSAGQTGDLLLRLDGSPAGSSPLLAPNVTTEVSFPPGAEAVTFSFNADSSLPLNLNISTNTSGFAFATQVYDPSGQLSLVGTGTAFTGITAQVPPGTGTYEVTIKSQASGQPGAVTLFLSSGSGVPSAPAGSTQPTVAPTQPQSAAPTTCQATAGSLNVNVRTGPGTNYSARRSLNARSSADVTGQSADGTWLVVTVNGSRGWVAASVVSLSGPCQSLPVIQAPPTPTPAPTTIPTAAPSAQITFTANGGSSTSITSGQCATVAWNVQNVQAVYYQGSGVGGSGSTQECPASTTTYTLDVTLTDGSTTQRTVTVNVSGGGGGVLSPSSSPNYGTVSLTAGFVPDPNQTSVTSGGPVDVSYLGGICQGYASSAPDLRLQYTAGAAPRLRFFFQGGADTTMVVRDPNGTWYCNDDGAGYPNPLVEITSPPGGTYDVWIASFSSGDFVNGTMNITELVLP